HLALVLSGGGARGAYQVGVLAGLAERLPGLEFPILTGMSVGAINTIYLAAHTGPLPAAVAGLSNEWSRLTSDAVYRVRSIRLVRSALRWAWQGAAGRVSGRPHRRRVLRGRQRAPNGAPGPRLAPRRPSGRRHRPGHAARGRIPRSRRGLPQRGGSDGAPLRRHLPRRPRGRCRATRARERVARRAARGHPPARRPAAGATAAAPPGAPCSGK